MYPPVNKNHNLQTLEVAIAKLKPTDKNYKKRLIALNELKQNLING